MSFTAQKNRNVTIIKRAIFIVFGLYIMIGSLLVTFQEKIIFRPTKLDQDYTYAFKTSFKEFYVKAPDGAKLNALHFNAETPKGLIVYFHGNAGDLSRWGAIVEPFVGLGFDVVVMDYRSYGKSSGKLSEQRLYSDAQLFYEYALNHYNPEDIIIYGRSLGTGIASKLASENKVQQLILETPYTSLEAVASYRFPIFPVETFLKYRLPTIEFIKFMECPITIFHGTEDAIVPYELGKKLKTEYPGKIDLITIEGGGHNDLASFATYQNKLQTILN